MVSPNVPKTLGYHHPCHAGNDDRDAAFLEYALGGRIHAQTTCECCGFGGVMGLAAPGLTGEANTVLGRAPWRGYRAHRLFSLRDPLEGHRSRRRGRGALAGNHQVGMHV